jgi:single-strand DNA-binding protein
MFFGDFMNKFIGRGNLGRDVELRYLSGGAAVAEVSLALSERFKRKDGSQADNTTWVTLEFWERNAEVAAQYLKKGSSILAEGSLKESRWEKDGVQHSRLKVRVDRFEILSPKGDVVENNTDNVENTESELVVADTGSNIPF